MATTTSTLPRLKQQYLDTWAKELQKELGFKNVNEVPRLEKVVVSVGLGRSKEDKKMFEAAENTLLKITAQKPVTNMAKKSIATFKLREGQRIGLTVTLRGDRMYEFVDRLLNIVLPRLRDFHGVPVSSFDRQGNFSIGFVDQSVFPELTFEDTVAAHGLQVNFGIRCRGPEDAKALLTLMGMPFEKGRK